MATRIIPKSFRTSCNYDECENEHREDRFKVVYDVEEDEHNELKIRTKGIDDPQLPKERGFAYIQHPCPWCKRELRFRVPLSH